MKLLNESSIREVKISIDELNKRKEDLEKAKANLEVSNTPDSKKDIIEIEEDISKIDSVLSLIDNKDYVSFLDKAKEILDESLNTKQAIAYIKGDKDKYLEGKVVFTDIGDEIKVSVDIINLPPSRFLGFHIHDIGDCSGKDFENVGDHYNPENKEHPYHKGDLPLIYSSNGEVHTDFLINKFNLDDIIGRSIIIHSQSDDFKSQPSGDSGDKIACGEIISNIRLREI